MGILKLQSNSIKVLSQNLKQVASSPTVKQEAEAVSATFTKAFEQCATRANVVTDATIKQTSVQMA